MLAELTFRQELWLAVVQAGAVVLGVGATVAFGVNQAKKAWERQQQAQRREHEHQTTAERDRLLRSERVALYRRLVEAATTATYLSASPTQPGDLASHIAEGSQRVDANRAWEAAYAETQLIGSPTVIEAAGAIDAKLRSRRAQSIEDAMRSMFPTTPEPEPEPIPIEVRIERAVALVNRGHDENQALLDTLIAACRSDLSGTP